MKNRSVVAMVMFVLAAVALAPVVVAGQEAAPRTAWGHPDLQGTYTSKTITPLQRPAELADRERLTAEEVANLEQEVADRNAELLARPARRTEVTESVDVGADGAPGFYNNFWLDRGTTSTGRTSIVVDPPDGRIPPLTPAAQRDEDARLTARSMPAVEADTWTDMDLNDRCMLWSVGPPMLPTGYNNNYMILQTPEYRRHPRRDDPRHAHHSPRRPPPPRPPDPAVAGRDARPLGGRHAGRRDPQHRPQRGGLVVRQRRGPHPRRQRWTHGEPAGRSSASPGSTPTRSATSSRSRIRPAGRARGPASCRLRRTDESLFEYACHEGNYSIVNMLSGARAEEREAAAGEEASR